MSRRRSKSPPSSLATIFLGAAIPLLSLLSLLSCSNPDNKARIQALVTENHFHTHDSNISGNLLDRGLRRFDLQFREGHTHTFDITEEQYVVIQTGVPVVVESTISENHTHVVTLGLVR